MSKFVYSLALLSALGLATDGYSSASRKGKEEVEDRYDQVDVSDLLERVQLNERIASLNNHITNLRFQNLDLAAQLRAEENQNSMDMAQGFGGPPTRENEINKLRRAIARNEAAIEDFQQQLTQANRQWDASYGSPLPPEIMEKIMGMRAQGMIADAVRNPRHPAYISHIDDPDYDADADPNYPSFVDYKRDVQQYPNRFHMNLKVPAH